MTEVICPECGRRNSVEVMRCPCGYPIEELKERHKPVDKRDPEALAPDPGDTTPAPIRSERDAGFPEDD